MIIDRRNIMLNRKANCAHQNIRLHIFPSSQFLALQLLIECAFIWLERVLEMHDSKPSLLALDWHNIGASEKQFGVSLWDLVLAWKGVLKVLTAKHRLLAREENTPGPREGFSSGSTWEPASLYAMPSPDPGNGPSDSSGLKLRKTPKDVSIALCLHAFGHFLSFSESSFHHIQLWTLKG